MNLISLRDWSSKEIISVLELGRRIKKKPSKYYRTLRNKTLAMLFQKTSTRTRMSFEAGMTQLGGHAQYLDWTKTNLTLGSLQDEIKCMARFADIIMARVYKHSDIEAIAEASTVPVINGLCDMYHPCQIIADLLTIKERAKKLYGTTLAYIGDGNNVCHSLLLGCTKTGIKINVATPKGYEPNSQVIKIAKKFGEVNLYNDPKKAVKNADIVYTDTWVSMGQEKEAKKRIKVFEGYTIDSKIMALSNDAYFMHCLPAHRGYEVADEVIDSKRSIVFDQAENRLHAQKAIILRCLGKY